MDDDDGLKWVDAPPKRWGPRKKPILTPEKEARLRANPGRWAQVDTFEGPSSAHQARKRWADNPQHIARDEWEFEARKFTDNSSALYGRYVGPAVDVDAEEIEEQVPDPGPDEESSPDAGNDELGGSTFRAPQEPAPEPSEEEQDDETALFEQVGVINGVCGPCRRLRCHLCTLPGCKCARPGHLSTARIA